MTDNTQTEALLPSRETLMAQAQVFASAWAIAGSRFDSGDGMEVAEQEKAILADMTRRLHARIAELEAQLDSIGAGGVSGPLMGQPQAMPDLSALTERGAKAWAGVDAQGLREGVASAGADCARCGGSGEVFEHSEDCDDDLCALNGDMHSCTGIVRQCACKATASPTAAGTTQAHIAAMERAWLWMENQADAQSKGGHATFDLMMLREERDALRAAIDAAASAGSEPVAADGWLHENGLLYRLTDERHPRNRDEINVTMADGSRSIESRSRRALELLDRIMATHPSEGMVGGWTKASQQLPPCRDDQLYLGVNSAGFAGVFNAVADIAGNARIAAKAAWQARAALDAPQPSPTPQADSQPAPMGQNESAYQRGYMDGMAKGRREAEAGGHAAPQPAVQQGDTEVLLIAAVDEWFAKNTGLGGCSDKDVQELQAIFAADRAARALEDSVTAPATDSYVQPVPDKCDRIVQICSAQARRWDMTEPTDAEAWEMWLSQPLTGHAQKLVGNFARAVLAKWGTPAVAGEPDYATFALWYADHIGDENKPVRDAALATYEAFATPQPTQAQAGAVPLYRLLQSGVDRIEAADEFLSDDTTAWAIDPNGIFVGSIYGGHVLRPARRCIKGGQHGAE